MLATPVLQLLDTTKLFIIETDALDYARGAQLIQVRLDRKEYLVAFNSRKFNSAERNYLTHKQELLAIKDAIKG